MIKFALVQDGIVQAIVEDLTEEQIQEYARTYSLIIDLTNYELPQVGYRCENFQFFPPDQTTPMTSMKISKLSLRQRFTTGELAGIYTAANSNVIIKILMDNLMCADFIDLARLDTQQGVGYLASLGLLTPARMTAILTTIPAASERWLG